MSFDLLTFVSRCVPHAPAHVLRWSVVDGNPMLHETIPLRTHSFQALLAEISAHCRVWPNATVALSPDIAAVKPAVAALRERLPGRRLIAMAPPNFDLAPAEIRGSTPEEREGRWMAEYVMRTDGRTMGNLIHLRPPVPMEPSYGLALQFDTDAPEFCHGFETGLLYARLEARPATWAGTYHAANEEMIRRVAASAGYICEIEASAPGWIGADFYLLVPS